MGRHRTEIGETALSNGGVPIGRLAKETGWGYSRILGELRKLGAQWVSHNTVKNILNATV